MFDSIRFCYKYLQGQTNKTAERYGYTDVPNVTFETAQIRMDMWFLDLREIT